MTKITTNNTGKANDIAACIRQHIGSPAFDTIAAALRAAKKVVDAAGRFDSMDVRAGVDAAVRDGTIGPDEAELFWS